MPLPFIPRIYSIHTGPLVDIALHPSFSGLLLPHSSCANLHTCAVLITVSLKSRRGLSAQDPSSPVIAQGHKDGDSECITKRGTHVSLAFVIVGIPRFPRPRWATIPSASAGGPWRPNGRLPGMFSAGIMVQEQVEKEELSGRGPGTSQRYNVLVVLGHERWRLS